MYYAQYRFRNAFNARIRHTTYSTHIDVYYIITCSHKSTNMCRHKSARVGGEVEHPGYRMDKKKKKNGVSKIRHARTNAKIREGGASAQR